MPEDDHKAVVLPDTSEPLGQVRDRDAASQSIVSAVLDIQKYADTRDKWIRSLECLYLPAEEDEDEDEDEPGGKRRWVDNGPSIASYVSPILRRSYLDPVSDPDGGRDYVAVSYTWDPSEEDEDLQEVGGYRIESRRAGESSSPSQVRDVVWDRVLRFARYVDCENIWIDSECVDQNDQVVKEEAIQNMHVVYSLSKRPIALLTRGIKTIDELDLLVSLLLDDIQPKDEAALLRLLDEITSDRWWTRAWTFQEDYKASTRMVFLIPHDPILEDDKRATRDFKNRPLLGTLLGEICVKSTDFRRAATKFCLAYRKKRGAESVCNKILKTAGKYNILLNEEYSPGPYPIARSMSPTIFADIGKRGILKESDRLAIAANCCGYTTRLDTNSLNKNRKSLSLSMLALYLLNGEIIENDPKRCRGTLKDDIFTYLSKQSLSSFRPPVDEELTFIKSCRYIDPQLTPEGTLTRGHLWKLGKVIRRKKPMKREKYRRLTPLEVLATELEYKIHGASYSDLATRLLAWTQEPPPPSADARYQRPWEWRDWMASEVQEALLEGHSLRLASLVHPKHGAEGSPYRAIFVSSGEDDDNDWEDDDSSSARYVFTSTRPAKNGRTGDIHKHVSLEVEVEWPKPESKDEEGRNRHVMPKLYIKRWRNGLCFFEGYPQRPVLFPHPPDLLARLDQ